MRCPSCGFDNLTGRRHLRQLRRRTCGHDIPQPATASSGQLLGEHLDELGAAAPVTVDPGHAAREAIRADARRRHDCVLVLDGDRLVGIFTDRDAVVKVAGQRLDVVPRRATS